MTLLDAYAVLAFFRGERAEQRAAELLRTGAASLTALGLSEVLDQQVRVGGHAEEEVIADLADLGLINRAITVGPALGLAAGRLRARHYHRVKCPISLADCAAAEAARHRREALATADPDLLEVCAREGIDLIVLPQSDGTTWRGVQQ